MLEPVLKAFEALLGDFSWRRVSALGALTMYVVILLSIGEAFSGYFRLRRIDHATKILARLQDMEPKLASSSSELAAVHSDLVAKLREINNPSTAALPGFSSLWKFLATATPWLLMTLIFIPGIRKKQPGSVAGLWGIIVLAVLAGFTGLIMPTFVWPWGNLLIYPVGLFVLFAVFAVRWQRQKNKRSPDLVKAS